MDGVDIELVSRVYREIEQDFPTFRPFQPKRKCGIILCKAEG
jgi:hypothetical protein